MDLLVGIQRDITKFLSSLNEERGNCELFQDNQNFKHLPEASSLCHVKIANDKKFKNQNADIGINTACFQSLTHSVEKFESAKEFFDGSESLVQEIGTNDQKTELSVKINREKSFLKFIDNICKLKEKYGHVQEKKCNLVLFNMVSNKREIEPLHKITLEDMRALATATHLKNILAANGSTCLMLHHNATTLESQMHNEQVKNISENYCSSDRIEQLERNLLIRCKESKFRRCEDMKEVAMAKDRMMEMDLGRYIMEIQAMCKEKLDFDKGIQYIKVAEDDEKPLSCLSDVCKFELKLTNAFQQLGEQRYSVLHVAPTRRKWETQISSLLWRLTCNRNELLYKMMLCCFGPCITSIDSVSEKQSFAKYLSLKCAEIREAYVSRYGSEVQGDNWDQTIQSVSIACIKFDILSVPLRNKVEFKFDTDSNSSRESLFVLYNYSRLCTLLRNHEKEVTKGNYKALPTVNDVDFSNLKEEAEWRLFVKYVIQFPLLINSLGDSLSKTHKFHVNPTVNKVCSFLTSMARDLSSYYHQTKVLLDPRPHLFPLMNARIYLVIALKQVMLNAFELIGINPPTQM
eukprot:gene6325-7050_t